MQDKMKYLLIAAGLALCVPAHAGEGSARDFAFSAYVYAKMCPNPQVPKASYKWINELVHSVSKNKQAEIIAKKIKEAQNDPGFCKGVGDTLKLNLQPDVPIGD
jgi:hypothetical protein